MDWDDYKAKKKELNEYIAKLDIPAAEINYATDMLPDYVRAIYAVNQSQFDHVDYLLSKTIKARPEEPAKRNRVLPRMIKTPDVLYISYSKSDAEAYKIVDETKRISVAIPSAHTKEEKEENFKELLAKLVEAFPGSTWKLGPLNLTVYSTDHHIINPDGKPMRFIQNTGFRYEATVVTKDGKRSKHPITRLFFVGNKKEVTIQEISGTRKSRADKKKRTPVHDILPYYYFVE